MTRWLLPLAVGWIVTVTALHWWLNPRGGPRTPDGVAFRVGFLPVT